MGIPLKNKNNPFLIIWANFDSDFIFTNKPSTFLMEFYEKLEEYTGMKCNIFLDLSNNKLPISTKYVTLSKEIVEICYNFLTEREKFEILSDLDFVLHNNTLIKALRLSQIYKTPLLYREGEEPVKLDFDLIKASVIQKYPISELVNAIDNSLVHLVGVLPIYYVQERDYKYIQLEKGLWSGIYGLPFPLEKNLKWIWDGNYASLIEFYFISSLTT